MPTDTEMLNFLIRAANEAEIDWISDCFWDDLSEVEGFHSISTDHETEELSGLVRKMITTKMVEVGNL